MSRPNSYRNLSWPGPFLQICQTLSTATKAGVWWWHCLIHFWSHGRPSLYRRCHKNSRWIVFCWGIPTIQLRRRGAKSVSNSLQRYLISVVPTDLYYYLTHIQIRRTYKWHFERQTFSSKLFPRHIGQHQTHIWFQCSENARHMPTLRAQSKIKRHLQTRNESSKFKRHIHTRNESSSKERKNRHWCRQLLERMGEAMCSHTSMTSYFYLW